MPLPWDWWKYPVWESVGQGACNFEYYRDFVESISNQVTLYTGPMNAVTQRRMDVIARQLNPDVGISSHARILAIKGSGKGGSCM